MTETTQGNEGNGGGKSRRARTSTERSREFRSRQREKAEEAARQAALQEAERKRAEHAQREAPLQNGQETADGVAEPVAPTGNDVAEVVAPVPAPKVEWLAWRILTPAERSAKPDILTVLVALALAAVSAGFSIVGLTSIFGGAFGPVIALGAVLELGKLRAVALLGTGRGARWLRATLVALVAVLMSLNAIGCYGFLAKAHIGHEVESDVAVTARLADIDARITLQSATLADIDRRLGQIDGAIEKAMAQGRTNGAMQLANDQRHTRTALQVDRMAAGKVLAELKVEKARIEGEHRMVEADLGPVQYLAALIGVDANDALRWFILAIAPLLDPAAVLLLLAATRRQGVDE